jgi:peptide/nickel transport system permease protein
MRITDIFLAFPRLILALAFVAALGPGIENAVIAIALTSWPPYARLARAETLTVRNADFIKPPSRCRAPARCGSSPHVVPLCLPSVIIRVTLDMAGCHPDRRRPRLPRAWARSRRRRNGAP